MTTACSSGSSGRSVVHLIQNRLGIRCPSCAVRNSNDS
jgi:DNA-directed RNA polymerase subunit RPC12/RpoP